MSQAETTQRRSIAPDDLSGWFFTPEKPRDGEALQELAQSLAQEQEDPIIVREIDGGLQGVNGFDRVQAVIEYGDEYGISELDAEVREMSDIEAARNRLVSDVFHEPDTYMDQARLVSMIHEEFDTQSDTAEYIGKSVSWVSKKLSRLSDPEPVQEAGEEGVITEDNASELSEKAEENPGAVERTIDYARENPEATRTEISDKLQEESETDRDDTEVRELVERAENLEGQHETLQEQAEEREQLKARRESLEARRNEIRTQLPESQAREYEALQSAKKDVRGLQNAIETANTVADTLEESAEAEAPTDAQEGKLADYEAELKQIKREFGRPTDQAVNGESDPVNVRERDDGTELWTIRVVVPGDDVPEPVQEIRQALETYCEKARQVEEWKAQIRRSESLSKRADKVRKDVSEILSIDTVSVDDMDPRVVQVLKSHKGDTIGELETELSEAEEEVESHDSEALEEAYEEYQESMEELDEIDEEVDTIEAAMPPQNVNSNLSQKADKMEDSREEAREAFNALPEDRRESLLEDLSEVYDNIDWLTAEPGESHDGPEIEMEHTGGGWYELSANGDSLKVQGEEQAIHVRETWESDGFEAAEEALN